MNKKFNLLVLISSLFGLNSTLGVICLFSKNKSCCVFKIFGIVWLVVEIIEFVIFIVLFIQLLSNKKEIIDDIKGELFLDDSIKSVEFIKNNKCYKAERIIEKNSGLKIVNIKTTKIKRKR